MNIREENIFDSSDKAFLLGNLMNKIYTIIDSNTLVSNELNYNEKKSLSLHYENYQKIKNVFYKKKSFID